MALSRLVPLVLLLGYAVAFGAAAFGASLPAFDDHPGQVYRLWHVLNHGPAPWTWNPGWWTGYPELQFYPPGFFYAGAALHYATLGTAPLAVVYQALLWLTWLAPGVAAFALLARLSSSGWAALPGGFVALTLSGAVSSGVEGGVHIGMLPARLGWALLPLLALALPSPRAGVPAALLAAIVLVHPAHGPAAIVAVALAAWLATGPIRGRLVTAGITLALAAGLTAFWTLPLLAHLAHTRALAWGRLAPLDTLGDHPLLAVLLVAAALAPRLARSPVQRLVALWPWPTIALVALDAAVLEPLGLRWLPADRISDAAWMAVVLAAGLSAARLVERLGRGRPLAAAGGAVLMIGAVAAAGLPAKTLVPWPRVAEWPSYRDVAAGLRLDDLWSTLRRAPPGRILFVRSGVPLVYGTEWWRPHSHVTALTPMATGREIVNGTFTHPSPVAAFVYRGESRPGAITTLVERLDGRSLFGRDLGDLDAATLAGHGDRLGVSVVVALDEDLPRLRLGDGDGSFARRSTVGPFAIFERRQAARIPAAVGGGRWRVPADRPPGAWTTARLAYYPLWSAWQGERRLATRRGRTGELEFRVEEPGPVDLVYRPGPAELTGLLVTAGALALVAGLGLRRRRRVSR